MNASCELSRLSTRAIRKASLIANAGFPYVRIMRANAHNAGNGSANCASNSMNGIADTDCNAASFARLAIRKRDSNNAGQTPQL